VAAGATRCSKPSAKMGWAETASEQKAAPMAAAIRLISPSLEMAPFIEASPTTALPS
jgi:hypothetical protein